MSSEPKVEMTKENINLYLQAVANPSCRNMLMTENQNKNPSTT